MSRLLIRYIIIALFVITTVSCKKHEFKIERAFYYWKNSEYSLNKIELNCLKNNRIQKLYVKFFEVDSDPVIGYVPTAKTELHIYHYYFSESNDSLLCYTMTTLEIIPTVFIRNKALFNVSKGSLDTLADNISFLVNKYYYKYIGNSHTGFREIQIDCDWTEGTKDNYFYLLRMIKAISNKSVSCTLRLYPYKYRDKMGVPPVDKAVLMCYNLTNPLTNENSNSIISTIELKKYLSKTKPYPLHIDFALPIFSWMQVYKNNQFAGIINPENHELDSLMKPIKHLWYEVTKDKELDNIYLREGDKIKSEEVTTSAVSEAILLLKKYVPFDNNETIILFHLDANNINKFDNEAISSFFADFSK
jgi:hypothetical protein